MVINGKTLVELAPIKNMLDHKVKGDLTSYGLSEAGYDIRIKQQIRFYIDHEGKRQVAVEGRWNDEPGRFTLASAIEEFQMPSSLVGIVHDKSTWARTGLSVFNTVIEPGWNGFLTLELVYNGDDDLIIPAGSGIAQVIFHSLCNAALYDGKYQNQEDRPVEARKSSDF